MADTKLIKLLTWNPKQLCWGRNIYEIDLTDKPIIGYVTWNWYDGEVLGCDFYYRGSSPRGDLWNFGANSHICQANNRLTLCGGMSDYYGGNARFLSWNKATCPECRRIAKEHPEYLPHFIDEDPKTMVVSFEDNHA